MKIKSLMILGTTIVVVAVLLIAATGIFILQQDIATVSEENTARARETIEDEIGSGAKNTAIEILSALDGKMNDQVLMVQSWASTPIVINTAKDAMSYSLEELYEAWSASSSRQFDGDEAMGDGKPSNDINPEASEYLIMLTETIEGYPEIFFTDARGYAIAANAATGDFDQGPNDWRVFKYSNGTEYYKKHDPTADGEGWWAAANDAQSGTWVSPVSYDESAGVWGREICVVIEDPDTGKNLGVLKSVYNFAVALSAVLEIEDLEVDSIKMITPEGLIAATSEADKTSVMNPEVTVADLESYSDAKIGGDGFNLEDDETGEEKLIGYASNLNNGGSSRSVANVDLICFVSYDPKTSYSPLDAVSEMENKNSDLIDNANQNSLIILISIIIISIIILVSLISVLNKRLTKPLIDMAHVAKDIKEGNLDVSVDESGDNEVSELAKAFNQMILSVRLIAGDEKSK